MGIDMTKYKMIYEGIVYNCLSMIICLDLYEHGKPNKIKSLEVTYIDSDNRVNLISDDVSKFQFISK